MKRFALIPALALAAACSHAPAPLPATRTAPDLSAAGRLPTGARLDPEGAQLDVGNFPLAMALSPDGRFALLSNSGWREQGIEVVDRETRRSAMTYRLPSTFLGLAFSADGGTVYASGGNQDVVYRCSFRDGVLGVTDSLMLAPPDTTPAANPVAPGEVRRARTTGKRYPAGLALSPDGRMLYVAENLGDALAVVDIQRGAVVQRFPTERYPYGVAVAPDGRVFVSAWGGRTVSVFAPADGGRLTESGRIDVGWHPSALLLSKDGARLFVASGSTDRVAVVDTRAARVLTNLADPPPAGPAEGSTPDALALSGDGARLFVAEADANAVAVFDLSPATAGPGAAGAAAGADRLLGRIPAGWYPSAVAVRGDTLLVLNAKGRGSAPNPRRPQPSQRLLRTSTDYTLGQIQGTLETVVGAADRGPRGPNAATFARWSARVARADGWDRPALAGPLGSGKAGYPPIEHVVYVIRENRTYDQVLGDLKQADGDTALVFFGRGVTPNAHALAERFGIFDRFFTNAEVSAQGHNWSTAAYASDYVEKTTPSNYSGRGRSYDYEGTNRDTAVSGIDDAAEPAMGYLWDAASRAGITFRNYGEFVERERDDPGAPAAYRGNKPFLVSHSDPTFPGFDLDIPDQHRADLWIRELQAFEQNGNMPALEIVRLPNDHTAGAHAGDLSPRAYVADNDLALGRMVEALSKTRFWKSTVVFVLEDDAQDGPDHVDSHRSPVLVISPWSRGGVSHRFANTTDVLATIADILGLPPLSRFQYYGRPLRDAFGTQPDLRPYVALTPTVPLSEKNTAATPGARESRRLSLRYEDSNDDDFFNRILWKAVKGNRPYPGSTRAPALELRR